MKVKNLSKNYGGLKAVNNVSMDVNFGEILALVGDNGAGKSTLLKLLAEITSPSKGEFYIKGKIAALLTWAKLAHGALVDIPSLVSLPAEELT